LDVDISNDVGDWPRSNLTSDLRSQNVHTGSAEAPRDVAKNDNRNLLNIFKDIDSDYLP
jgi:hypothetical protein